jgi:filamentous hemagglutinin family protein
MGILKSLDLFDADRTALSAAVALLFVSISIAAGGDTGNILTRSNPAINATQQANAANRLAQTTQAIQAMQNATNTLRGLTKPQINPIRGGNVVVNISKNPVAVPSQVLRSIQVNGKVYVIDRNGIIFGGSRQINTHELTGAAMGATSDWMTDLAKKQRAATAPKAVPSNVTVEVLGYGTGKSSR